MRTTLDLDPDVLEAARELARAQGISIGAVVSAIVRAGLRPAPVEFAAGLPLIRARPDSPIVTSEMVRRAQDDG